MFRSGRSRGVRYVCELLVGLLLVSFFLRTWLVQGLIVPVTVSGGSMATTLQGPHYQSDCQWCGFAIRYGTERPPLGDQLVCPNCGKHTPRSKENLPVPGDWVIIDRTAFQWRAPTRWEVVVFRCLEKSQSYCVKRVVALPGESVRISDGDIFIDGQIATKDFRQVRGCAQLVHDSSHLSPSSVPRWHSDHQKTRWQSTADSFAFNRRTGSKSSKHYADWLVYHHAGGEPIRDDCGYNQGESRVLNEVVDIGLSGQFSAAGLGSLLLKANHERDWFQIQLQPHEGRLTLSRNEQFVVSLDVDLTSLLAVAEIEFWLVDRQVMLAVNRQTVLRYPYQPSSRGAAPSPSPVAIAAENIELQIRQLKLWRDIYYTDPGPGQNHWGLDQPYLLENGQFFVLGDNSPISDDSRTLGVGGIDAKLLIGKPLGVE